EVHAGNVITRSGVGVKNERVIRQMVAAAVSQHQGWCPLGVGQLVNRVGIALSRYHTVGHSPGPRAARHIRGTFADKERVTQTIREVRDAQASVADKALDLLKAKTTAGNQR